MTICAQFYEKAHAYDIYEKEKEKQDQNIENSYRKNMKQVAMKLSTETLYQQKWNSTSIYTLENM